MFKYNITLIIILFLSGCLNTVNYKSEFEENGWKVIDHKDLPNEIWSGGGCSDNYFYENESVAFINKKTDYLICDKDKHRFCGRYLICYFYEKSIYECYVGLGGIGGVPKYSKPKQKTLEEIKKDNEVMLSIFGSLEHDPCK